MTDRLLEGGTTRILEGGTTRLLEGIGIIIIGPIRNVIAFMHNSNVVAFMRKITNISSNMEKSHEVKIYLNSMG